MTVFNGSVLFLSASAKDALSRVTIRNPFKQTPVKGDRAVVKFQYSGISYSILFYANREDGSTYKTTSWPYGLPTLQPGVQFNVLDCEIESI